MRAVRAPADAGLASKRTTSVEGGHPGRLRSSGGIYTAVHLSATTDVACGRVARNRQLSGLLRAREAALAAQTHLGRPYITLRTTSTSLQ